jgi:NAD(P)-dependent dehydrogenase (short-subunit alcohol dehydrogenase family)
VGALEGRVAIVTGAGGGLGREHALLFAAEGAKVVVNDLGGSVSGDGTDPGAAELVVAEILAMGGDAIANGDDVSDWDGAKRLIDTALEAYGGLDVLVNNAGILRDRLIVNMTEAEWDAVVRVHMKGHFAPTHHAAAYWRDEAKAGREPNASVINTSSTSGLIGNIGQGNYGAAKAGIAAFTVIAAQELIRYGVRVNAIAPGARTRMTELTPGLSDIVAPPAIPGAFDMWAPANVSPLVAYLGTEGCPSNGRVFFVMGGKISIFHPWELSDTLERTGRWTVAELQTAMIDRLRVDEPVGERPLF